MQKLFLTTTGILYIVKIKDLRLVFNHQNNNYNLLDRVDIDKLINSKSLYNSLANNEISLNDEYNNLIEIDNYFQRKTTFIQDSQPYSDFQNKIINIQVDNTLNPSNVPKNRYIITDKNNLHVNFGTIINLDNNDIIEYSDNSWKVVYKPNINGDGALVFNSFNKKWYEYKNTEWLEFFNLSNLGTYIHTQLTPQTIWNINHNLNGKPNINFYDEFGNLFYTYYNNINNMSSQAIMNFPSKGTAICKV